MARRYDYDEYDLSPSNVLTPAEKLYQYQGVVTSTGNVPKATIETFGGTANDFVRNRAQEAAAIASGSATKAEIEARGGVNASGYYGNTYDPQTSLTDTEYAAAVAEGGMGVNAALDAKMAKNFPVFKDNLSSGATPSLLTGTALNTGTTSELAIDVFRKTIGLFMGEAEMAKPWVSTLYTSVSKYYKSGATADESINFALQDVRNNKDMTDFTNRFKGIYALQDLKVKGQAVTVPTIAEYFASESKMGDILKSSGLGELATEDFLGGVLGKGVSVTEFNNRITNIFNKIDFAPEEVKSTIKRYFPYVDRISLAKALATGEKGATQLAQDVAGYEVLSAAESQGLGGTQISQGLDLSTATNYARAGLDYQTALGKFSQIAQIMPVERKLAQISNKQSIGQVGLERAIINKSASDLTLLQDLTKEEEARFQGSSGRFASKDRGSGQY